MLFKEIVDGWTDARTYGRMTDIEGSQKLTEHFVLRWAKKFKSTNITLYNYIDEQLYIIFSYFLC